MGSRRRLRDFGRGVRERFVYVRSETVFATFIILACLCSLIIMHISGTVSSPKKRLRPGKPFIHVQKHIAVASLESSNKQQVIVKQPEKDLPVLPALPWFKSVKQSNGKLPLKKETRFNGYIIENPDLCSKDRVDLLIYFQSEVGRYANRAALRETWANRNNFRDIRVKVVFFLGEAARPEDGPGVLMEQDVHGDIVQGEFLDTFRNLSLKSIMAAHWITSHCSNARYVIKTDDDVFVNIFLAMEKFIPGLGVRSKTVICPYHGNGTREIQRDSKSRWFVNETELAGKHFPQFCSGYFVLMTPDVIPELYHASLAIRPISVDDAFLFGLSAAKVQGLTFWDLSENFTLQRQFMLKQYNSTEPITFVATIVQYRSDMHALYNLALARLTDWPKQHVNDKLIPKSS